MAGFGRVYPDRREDGYPYIYHQKILHIHILFNAGITCDFLLFSCILDEYQAVYRYGSQKPIALSLNYSSSDFDQFFQQWFE